MEEPWGAPWKLLEIGAGDGRLSHFLSLELQRERRGEGRRSGGAGTGAGEEGEQEAATTMTNNTTTPSSSDGSSSSSSSSSSSNSSGARVVATDSYGWGLKKAASSFAHVEDMAFEAALKKHEPRVVLVSWMPMGVDWTAAIRATPSVQEYVLVGEADDGCCGHNWLTWGNPAFQAQGGGTCAGVPPYVAEGWTR